MSSIDPAHPAAPVHTAPVPRASPPPLGRGLFVLALLYGGMVCIAGVLGAKQVAIGPLAVEAGIFPFLMLVSMGAAVAERYGRQTADRLVAFGFVPMLTAMALIMLVLALPADPDMYPPLKQAFPIVLGQNWRLMAAGLLAYGISQMLNITVFTLLGRRRAGMVGIRGAIASTLSQIVDTLIFVTVAFWGTRPIAGLLLGQMTAKIILSIILVPLLVKGFVRLAEFLER